MDKKYEILIPKDANYAYFRILKPIDAELARGILSKIDETSKEQELTRFLIDVRAVFAKTSPFEDFDIAYSKLGDSGLNRRTKFAVLRSPSDKTHRFAETAIRNAGYKFTLFTDEDAAIKWLEQ